MENEPNQVPTEEMNVSSDEENLFDDYEAEDTTETTEESNEAESSPEPEANPFGLKVTYNGEEQTLNEDDARSYAQKGMNYDKIYEPLQRLTRMHGLNSVGELLNMLNDTEVQYQISNEMDRMREDPKYENVSDEILEEIATAKVNESISNQDYEFENAQKEQADAESARLQRDVEKFFNEYPEFRGKSPDSIDQGVYDLVKQGYTLLEAYQKWSRDNPQTKVSKLNEENKKKSLGNTTNAGKVDNDDFLSGFLNG